MTPIAPIRIAGISGSLRQASFSTALIKLLAERVSHPIELSFVDISVIHLYNEDLDGDNKPAAVHAVNAAIAGPTLSSSSRPSTTTASPACSRTRSTGSLARSSTPSSRTSRSPSSPRHSPSPAASAPSTSCARPSPLCWLMLYPVPRSSSAASTPSSRTRPSSTGRPSTSCCSRSIALARRGAAPLRPRCQQRIVREPFRAESRPRYRSNREAQKKRRRPTASRAAVSFFATASMTITSCSAPAESPRHPSADRRPRS